MRSVGRCSCCQRDSPGYCCHACRWAPCRSNHRRLRTGWLKWLCRWKWGWLCSLSSAFSALRVSPLLFARWASPQWYLSQSSSTGSIHLHLCWILSPTPSSLYPCPLHYSGTPRHLRSEIFGELSIPLLLAYLTILCWLCSLLKILRNYYNCNGKRW